MTSRQNPADVRDRDVGSGVGGGVDVEGGGSTAGRQRIDLWLWHARIVRTRSAAASLAAAGHVRVNGTRIDAAGRAIKCGDVLTIRLDRSVRVLRVCGFVSRRGKASTVQSLYEDLGSNPTVRVEKIVP